MNDAIELIDVLFKFDRICSSEKSVQSWPHNWQSKKAAQVEPLR